MTDDTTPQGEAGGAEVPTPDLSAYANRNGHLRNCPCPTCTEPEPTSDFELMQSGGSWLGAVRSGITWLGGNGDRVTWGSDTELKPALTVCKVEELAARAAAAAHNDALKHAKDYYGTALDQSRAEVERLQAELAAKKRLLAEADAACAYDHGDVTVTTEDGYRWRGEGAARHQARQGGDDG